jgi:hypothetical protein
MLHFVVRFHYFVKWPYGSLSNPFANRIVFITVYHFAVAGLRIARRKHRTVYHSGNHHARIAADKMVPGRIKLDMAHKKKRSKNNP